MHKPRDNFHLPQKSLWFTLASVSPPATTSVGCWCSQSSSDQHLAIQSSLAVWLSPSVTLDIHPSVQFQPFVHFARRQPPPPSDVSLLLRTNGEETTLDDFELWGGRWWTNVKHGRQEATLEKTDIRTETVVFNLKMLALFSTFGL